MLIKNRKKGWYVKREINSYKKEVTVRTDGWAVSNVEVNIEAETKIGWVIEKME